jgi:hypothetical protein
MDISTRQVVRLKGEFNIGRLLIHAVPEDIRKQVIDLKTSKLFENAIFNHFREILGREKFISISVIQHYMGY